MKKFPIVSLLTALMLISTPAMSILLTESQEEQVIDKAMFLADPDGKLDPETVLSNQVSFQAYDTSKPGFDMDTKIYWLRFEITNTTVRDNDWLVDFDTWSDVRVYTRDSAAAIQEMRTGHMYPFRLRSYPVANKNYVLLSLNKGETKTCYVRLESKPDHTIFPTNLNFRIAQRSYQDKKDSNVERIISIFMGIMFAIFLYNLFIYFSTREKNYVIYLAILALTIYMTASNSGYIVEFLGFWDGFADGWRAFFESFFSALTTVLMIFFTMGFLNTRENLPFWHKVLRIIFILTTVLFIGSNINFTIFGPIIFLVGILFFIVLLIVGIRSVIKKIPSGGYYLLAYSFTVAGIIILFLMYGGALPKTDFTAHYAMPLGYTLEMIFFSFALANKINILTEENIQQLERNKQLQTKVNRELEQKVQERTKEIQEQKEIIESEKEKSDNLLLNILPESTAEELKEKGHATPRHYDHSTILFTDFKGFTKIAEKLSAEELVQDLDYCFQAFDDIVARHNLEKIKTIGDAYMCAGGIPIPNETNAVDAVNAGLEMQEFMKKWSKEKEAKGQTPWELRVGIHTGPCTAGVVGKKKFAYDIWGDAVNLASRMESTGASGKVNVSENTWALIREHFTGENRGKIAAKNKGEIGMYFVEHKN